MLGTDNNEDEKFRGLASEYATKEQGCSGVQTMKGHPTMIMFDFIRCRQLKKRESETVMVSGQVDRQQWRETMVAMGGRVEGGK